jgi:hypothetical protein
MSRSKLLDEQVEIARLREEGQTLKQIAHSFGKSIYWVNSRLNPSYQPKRLRRAQGSDNGTGFNHSKNIIAKLMPRKTTEERLFLLLHFWKRHSNLQSLGDCPM